MLSPFFKACGVGVALLGTVSGPGAAAVPSAAIPILHGTGVGEQVASAMSLAIKAGNAKAVRQLLEAGAVPDGPPGGRPPLIAAAMDCRPDIAMLLLRYGANPGLRYGPTGATPLLAACQSSCAAVVRLLIAHGADPHAATSDGVTPLMAAAWWGSAGCLRVLLSHEPDLLAVDHQGHDGVYFAALRGHAACLQMLLDAGAAADRCTIRGWTPLLAAARSGCDACVKRLLAHGVSCSQPGPHDATPLDEAAMHCHAAVVSTLLSAGAQPTHVTFDHAITAACPSVVRALLESRSTWKDARSRLAEARRRVDATVGETPMTAAMMERLESCRKAIEDAWTSAAEGKE